MEQFEVYAMLDGSEAIIAAKREEETFLTVTLRNMAGAKIVAVKGGLSVTLRREMLTVVAFRHENALVVQLVNKSASPEAYTFTFGHSLVSNSSNKFTIQSPTPVEVLAERCTCVLNNDSIQVHPGGSMSILTFQLEAPAVVQGLALVAAASTEGVYTVPTGGRVPEFSIAVFDDAARTAPRPVRLGVPVISTVPVLRAGLSESEQQVLDIGKGLKKRTMYFKIISDVLIPVDVTPLLHVQLPEGLDTVGEPIPVEMVRQTSTHPGRSVFHSSYTFHAEDTVTYVDGFAYLSVYLPMEVETELPLGVAVTVDGSDITDPYADDPTQG
ncbi:MAG: hypothetical protein JSS66_04850 [Armatimonadetes bacterium]|nr:hypothetical protein [Armatimonadota bacterium]